jgi:3-dehydroquinate dehydratase-2
MNILIINGPNLNFLGIREPLIYGAKTYGDLRRFIKDLAKTYHFRFTMFQSNHEGDLVDMIQRSYFHKYDALIINPGAFTHYSYAIYDALKSIPTKAVEVHLSDITKREAFRNNDVIKAACVATFMGNHFESYHDAIKYIIRGFKNE